MTALALSFNNIELSPVEHNSQIWLTSIDLAKSLGYSQENAITKIFNRHKEEFTDSMSVLIQFQTGSLAESSGLQTEQRIFSLRGCHLLAMFARTTIAKEFRKWVLDVLDNPTQPAATTDTIHLVLRDHPALETMILKFQTDNQHFGRWFVTCDSGLVEIKPMTKGEFVTTSEQLANAISEPTAVERKHLPGIIKACAARII